MKIKILVHLSGAVSYRPGEIVDLPDRHARRLIGRKMAVPVAPVAPAGDVAVETTAHDPLAAAEIRAPRRPRRRRSE